MCESCIHVIQMFPVLLCIVFLPSSSSLLRILKVFFKNGQMSQNSDVQSAKFLASCTFVISADVLLRLLRLSRVMLNKLKYSVLFVQFHIAFTNVMLTSSLMYLFLLTCGSCYPPQAIWKKPAIVEDIYIDRQFSGIFIAGSKS